VERFSGGPLPEREPLEPAYITGGRVDVVDVVVGFSTVVVVPPNVVVVVDDVVVPPSIVVVVPPSTVVVVSPNVLEVELDVELVDEVEDEVVVDGQVTGFSPIAVFKTASASVAVSVHEVHVSTHRSGSCAVAGAANMRAANIVASNSFIRTS
jgi:hypothetical protein